MITTMIMTILPLIMPYIFLGENLCSLILAITSIIFLLLNKKLTDTNKIYKTLLMMISIIIIATQIFVSPYLESFSGTFIYINMLLYYFVFLYLLDKKNIDIILKYQSIAVTLILIFFIIYEGFYYNIRISGNLMYSNSYALLLLITIYFNYIRKEDKLTDYIESILVLGLLFTQSRTTLILLLLYLLLKIRNEVIIKKRTLGEIILPTIFGLLQYIIYSKILMASIFVFPIFIYIYKSVKQLAKKINFKALLAILSIILVLFIFSDNTVIERFNDISLKSGTLQERFIYFEDAFQAIKANPFGNGINMFMYKSYDTASAFYDVKYIHNSILQVAYDNGIIVALLFIILLTYGGLYINKNKHTHTLFLLTIYLSIIAHSLMDFDFSFSTISILTVFIIVLNKKLADKKSELSKSKKPKINKIALICLLIFASYLLIFESTISIAKVFALNNQYENSNTAYKFAFKIGGNLDGRPYFNAAQNSKNLDNLNEALIYLDKAEKIYPFNPMVQWNMAYIYEELGDDLKVIELRNNLLHREKYNKELYDVYNDYLHKKYNETEDEQYKVLLELVDSKFKEAQKNINKRAKYIKNQIQS